MVGFGIDLSKYLGTTRFPQYQSVRAAEYAPTPAGHMELNDAYAAQPGATGQATVGNGAGQFVPRADAANQAALDAAMAAAAAYGGTAPRADAANQSALDAAMAAAAAYGTGSSTDYNPALAPAYGQASARMAPALAAAYDPNSLRNARPGWQDIDNRIEDPANIPNVNPRELMGQAEQDVTASERAIPDFMPTFERVKQERMSRLDEDLKALGVNASRQKQNIADLKAGPMPSFGAPGTAMGDLSASQQMMFQKAYDFASNNVDTQAAGAEVQLRSVMNKTLDDVLGTVAERYFDGNVQQALDHPKLVLQAMEQYGQVMGKNQDIQLGQNQIIGQNRRQTSELNNRDNALQYTETGQDARQSQLLASQMAGQAVDFAGRAVLQDTGGLEQHNQFNADLATTARQHYADSANMMEAAYQLALNGQKDASDKLYGDAFIEKQRGDAQIKAAQIAAGGGSSSSSAAQTLALKAAQAKDTILNRSFASMGAIEGPDGKIMTSPVSMNKALEGLFAQGRGVVLTPEDSPDVMDNPGRTLQVAVGAALANPNNYSRTDINMLVEKLAQAQAGLESGETWVQDPDKKYDPNNPRASMKLSKTTSPKPEVLDKWRKAFMGYVADWFGDGLDPADTAKVQQTLLGSVNQGRTQMTQANQAAVTANRSAQAKVVAGQLAEQQAYLAQVLDTTQFTTNAGVKAAGARAKIAELEAQLKSLGG